MAKAPKPASAGTTKHNEAVSAAKQVMVMTLRGETRRLAIGSIPLKEKLLVQQATGEPLESWMNKPSEITMAILWWLSGRAAGNAFLTFDKVCAEWPTDLSEDDLSIDVVDADELTESDPES